MWFFHKKTNNPNYESTLHNLGVNSFDKDIKLLVIADTHGDLSLNKNLYKKLINVDYDLCCILGDVHYNDYKVILKYVPKEKIVSILGNHDMFNIINEYRLNDINGRIVEVKGIKIGAIQGSFKYKRERFPSFTHEESIEFLKDLGDVDILLSHDKPFVFNYNDPAHDGLKGITKYLYERKVPINIHGHIHKSYLDKLSNGTQIKGVYLIELITIKNGKVV